MRKKIWNGSGVLADGVEVKFVTRVGHIRRIKPPHPWPSPAAEIKREEAEKAAEEAAQEARKEQEAE